MDAADEIPEVVQDFKEALEDLKVNSKPEIDVLTLIAKENTIYAQELSAALEEHIKQVGLHSFPTLNGRRLILCRLAPNGSCPPSSSWTPLFDILVRLTLHISEEIYSVHSWTPTDK